MNDQGPKTIAERLSSKFIVLDGPEGAGKSTQAGLLLERLEAMGVRVLRVRDPGTTRVGEMVRAILLDPANIEMGMRAEMLLYMAARAQMMQEVIRPALALEKTVLCDRFVSSTLAYQVGGDGLTAAEIRHIADIAIKERWPDVTVILDMPADRSLARVKRKKDRIEQRPAEYHDRVRENYRSQAREDPQRYRLVSAEGSVEEVSERIWEAIISALPPV